MRTLTIGITLLLAGCGTIYMPTPVAYSMACPEGDVECQRKLDAQTLKYIGEDEAALKLMCLEPRIKEVIGERCVSMLQLGSSYIQE